MKKFILVVVIPLLCFTTKSFTQAPTKLKLMQGIWSSTMDTDTVKSYKIIANKNCLDYTYNVDGREISFLEMTIAFQSSVKWSEPGN